MRKKLGNYWPVVIDLETSGVVSDKNAILEVAAIPLEFNSGSWGYSEIWHEHIIPFEGAEFSPEAMAVHGIDADHPFRMAISEAAWLTNWQNQLAEVAGKNKCQRCMLAGHNAHFDLNFVMAAVSRCSINIPLHKFTCFDTATMGAYMCNETVLPRILRKSGIKYNSDSAHSAVYDTKVTADLIIKWLNQS